MIVGERNIGLYSTTSMSNLLGMKLSYLNFIGGLLFMQPI